MTNQKNPEIIKIQEQTDTDYLRRYLKQCESEILRLAYDESDEEMLNFSNEDLIVAQAKIRCEHLNRMFELNCSEASLRDLEATNNRLIQMETKVREIHKHRHKQLTCILQDYQLSTVLIYHHNTQNPQLIVRKDDGFYGSQWNDMIYILHTIHSEVYRDGLLSCFGNFLDSHHNDLPFNEPCDIDLALPHDISFCYSLRQLCNSQYYSIPDIMRMSTYHICQEVILEEALDVSQK